VPPHIGIRVLGTMDTNLGMQRRIQAIKDKRAAKEEKARYEKMAETMHRKRVERLKRKEKRNKMLKS
jgi:rRNA-processing protein CGR1